MIICSSDDALKENLATEPTAPDEPYISVIVSLTPDEAQAMINTLDSNGSSERAARDPLARAVLEAIDASGLLNA